ncbi:hypothetical protein TSAR_012430 [Trichomalopsis sarcophagae]|uniref:Uncharacterized protein n=1 Tax=Trichomalopsis sarcophagae TaxID=543379 RepID=A0A232F294_9HYME|nr:hypothetical protein TSAR_012430 [Trichomalopsis sarcophagae]
MKKKIYGIRAKISNNPELNTYIANILAHLKYLIEKDKIFNAHKHPAERFIFKFIGNESKKNALKTDVYFDETDNQLKILCLKLSSLKKYLKELSKYSSSYLINIVTNNTALINNENIKQDFPWIVDHYIKPNKNGVIFPINNLNMNCLFLQCLTIQ